MIRIVIVVAVEFNPEKTHIAKVQSLVYTGGTPKPEILTREEIIKMIDDGFQVYSLAKDGKGAPSSSEVIVYEHNGQKFLKTKPDRNGVDNLGALPPIAA